MNTLSNIIPSPLLINKTLNSNFALSKFATSDFNGKDNTEMIRDYKENVLSNNLDKGLYIGGIGELGLIFENISYINNVIDQYNGTPISYNGKYASSTFYYEKNMINKEYNVMSNVDKVWVFNTYNGMISYESIYNSFKSLPVYKYNIADFDSTEDDYDGEDINFLYIDDNKFEITNFIFYSRDDQLDNYENTITYAFYEDSVEQANENIYVETVLSSLLNSTVKNIGVLPGTRYNKYIDIDYIDPLYNNLYIIDNGEYYKINVLNNSFNNANNIEEVYKYDTELGTNPMYLTGGTEQNPRPNNYIANEDIFFNEDVIISEFNSNMQIEPTYFGIYNSEQDTYDEINNSSFSCIELNINTITNYVRNILNKIKPYWNKPTENNTTEKEILTTPKCRYSSSNQNIISITSDGEYVNVIQANGENVDITIYYDGEENENEDIVHKSKSITITFNLVLQNISVNDDLSISIQNVSNLLHLYGDEVLYIDEHNNEHIKKYFEFTIELKKLHPIVLGTDGLDLDITTDKRDESDNNNPYIKFAIPQLDENGNVEHNNTTHEILINGNIESKKTLKFKDNELTKKIVFCLVDDGNGGFKNINDLLIYIRPTDNTSSYNINYNLPIQITNGTKVSNFYFVYDQGSPEKIDYNDNTKPYIIVQNNGTKYIQSYIYDSSTNQNIEIINPIKLNKKSDIRVVYTSSNNNVIGIDANSRSTELSQFAMFNSTGYCTITATITGTEYQRKIAELNIYYVKGIKIFNIHFYREGTLEVQQSQQINGDFALKEINHKEVYIKGVGIPEDVNINKYDIKYSIVFNKNALLDSNNLNEDSSNEKTDVIIDAGEFSDFTFNTPCTNIVILGNGERISDSNQLALHFTIGNESNHYADYGSNKGLRGLFIKAKFQGNNEYLPCVTYLEIPLIGNFDVEQLDTNGIVAGSKNRKFMIFGDGENNEETDEENPQPEKRYKVVNIKYDYCYYIYYTKFNKNGNNFNYLLATNNTVFNNTFNQNTNNKIYTSNNNFIQFTDKKNINNFKIFKYVQNTTTLQRYPINKENIINYPIYINNNIYSMPLLPSRKVGNYYECEFYIVIPEFKIKKENYSKIYTIDNIYNNIRINVKFGNGEIKRILEPYKKLYDVVLYKFKAIDLFDYMFVQNQELYISVLDISESKIENKILYSKKIFYNLFKFKLEQGKYQNLNLQIQYSNYYPLKYPLKSSGKRYIEIDYIPMENISKYSEEKLVTTKLGNTKYSGNFDVNMDNLSFNYSYLNTNISHNISETNDMLEWFLNEHGNGLNIGKSYNEDDLKKCMFISYISNNSNINYELENVSLYKRHYMYYDKFGILDTTINISNVNKITNEIYLYDKLNRNSNIEMKIPIYGLKEIIYLVDKNKFDIEQTYGNPNAIKYDINNGESHISVFDDYLFICNITDNDVEIYFTDESKTLCESTRKIVVPKYNGDISTILLYKLSRHDNYNIILKNYKIDNYIIKKCDFYNYYNITESISNINNINSNISNIRTNLESNINEDIISIPVFDYTIPKIGHFVQIEKQI